MIVARCFIGFLIFSRKSLGKTFKETLDGRIESIQEELQQFFNPNEVIPEESNEQQRLLRISLRICSTVVDTKDKERKVSLALVDGTNAPVSRSQKIRLSLEKQTHANHNKSLFSPIEGEQSLASKLRVTMRLSGMDISRAFAILMDYLNASNSTPTESPRTPPHYAPPTECPMAPSKRRRLPRPNPGVHLDIDQQKDIDEFFESFKLKREEASGDNFGGGNPAGSSGGVDLMNVDEAAGFAAESPLDPFAIHPLDIIPLPLALALGLVILISFFFLREVWKNWYGMRVREKKQWSSVKYKSPS
jgi:hypothetical protein